MATLKRADILKEGQVEIHRSREASWQWKRVYYGPFWWALPAPGTLVP